MLSGNGVDISQPQSEASPAAAEPIRLPPLATTIDAAPRAENRNPKSEIRNPKSGHDGFSFRHFIASAVMFAIIVLTLRAIALEPFGVPTGSMAATLYGNHKTCACPRCGFPVIVGAPGGHRTDANIVRDTYAGAWCPNCYQTNLHLDRVPETAGDRLLVDKNVFEWRSPRRWEVAVFRNPSDLSKPYVKRVVGLPGEAVQIREGDVYINERLVRKSLEECRAMRVLVFDNDFQPAGDGWKKRWRTGAPDSLPPQLAREKSLPDADEHLEGTALKWSSRGNDFEWLVYRHWLLDENREESIRDWFAYNGGALRHELNDAHDFQVAFEVEVGAGSGAFAMKLSDGRSTVTAEIPVVASDQPAQGVTITGVESPPAAAPWIHFRENRTHRVEFALVDRRVMLAIDGSEAFPPINLAQAGPRNPVSRPVWLGVKGAPVVVRHFRLYRDVHYSPSGRNAIYEAWPLGKDDYFMLGDNSPNSEDSRYWTVPGIPARNFLGKPLLLHQPSRWGQIGNWQMQFLDWGRIQWIR
jgi:signal peptidase I